MPGHGQRKIQSTARLAIPLILLGLMILLGLLSLPVPYAGSARPALVLMAVYYWAIYRPTLVPPFLCFAAGLLTDILSGMPLGLNALVLVIVQWIVRSQRRFLMGPDIYGFMGDFRAGGDAGSGGDVGAVRAAGDALAAAARRRCHRCQRLSFSFCQPTFDLCAQAAACCFPVLSLDKM